MKIAINGFGRIGRAAFKALLGKKGLEVAAINDLTDTVTLAHLLKFDSCYGRYAEDVSSGQGRIMVNGNEYPVTAEKEPGKLPWKELGVDIVLECTGRFLTKELSSAHIAAGARKVIISAPAKGEGIKTFVLGVNEDQLGADDAVISMASCTTNCLAPATKVISDAFGIEKAVMTTIHSYTADQNLVDSPHKDLRRARAAALNMAPTTTGAAIAVTETIPELLGKFDGMAVRVPTPVGSISDIVFLLSKNTDEEAINGALVSASQTSRLKGILVCTTDEIVTSDIVGNPASSIIDLKLTKVVGGNLAKIVAWYDNEWGYSNRLADFCEFLKKF